MTELYDWNPMPHKVDIKCKRCNNLATFEFAEAVRIKLKKDVPFFQNSSQFEYQLLADSCGHKYHAAFYFSGLHGSESSITELPEGYRASDWSHSKYLMRNHGYDIGSVTCKYCSVLDIHYLNWPLEAYYSLTYKNNTLWAFNRDSANELLSFIESSDRDESQYSWQSFLRHIPTVFKTKKGRPEIVKKLRRLL